MIILIEAELSFIELGYVEIHINASNRYPSFRTDS